MVVEKGEIWWASLGLPRGSEPANRRPVVIISANEFNISKISTVIAVAITSNLRLAEAPGNFVVSPKDSGLPKESVVNVSQLLTLDKAFLTERGGKLPAKKQILLDDGLKLVLSL